MLEVLSAPRAVRMWRAQCSALNRTPCEDSVHFAACIGSVRGLGWSRLDVSKHLFGIYLSEAFMSHSFILAWAPGMSGSQHRLPPHTKPGYWAIVRANTGPGVDRLFFYPGSVQWWKSYAHIVLPWQGGWCRSRPTGPKAAQPAAAAASEFCLWYSPATISIHSTMQVAIWGKIHSVRETSKGTTEPILYRHLQLPCRSSG